MQKSLLSSQVNDSDCRRAPLATFDTVDLGEEDIVHLSRISNKFLHHENISGSNSGLNFNNRSSNEGLISGSNSSLEELDSISWKLSDRYMNTGYQKVRGTPKDADEEVTSLSVESVSHLDSSSDTDSSDSDAGYVKSGYISVKDGKVTKHEFCVTFEPVESTSPSKLQADSQKNTTGQTGQCPPRSPLPVLKRELENEKNISKRKALEKRIQRLQVTINPVERPRSTTPINVVTLEEYVDISSPEKSPPESAEKLKIKLPGSEFQHRHHKSPRKSRGSFGSKESDVFSFDEEHLFTRTKSALLMQDDGTPGNSPKRILIPPTLSPSLTPSGSPVRTFVGSSPRLPKKFIYIPDSSSTVHNKEKDSDQSWAAFGDGSVLITGNETKVLDTNCVSNQLTSKTLSADTTGLGSSSNNENLSWVTQIEEGSMCANISSKDSFSKISELLQDDNTEEILTINITENDGQKTCDINFTQLSDEKTFSNNSHPDNHDSTENSNMTCDISDRDTSIMTVKEEKDYNTQTDFNPNVVSSAGQTLPDVIAKAQS